LNVAINFGISRSTHPLTLTTRNKTQQVHYKQEAAKVLNLTMSHNLLILQNIKLILFIHIDIDHILYILAKIHLIEKIFDQWH